MTEFLSSNENTEEQIDSPLVDENSEAIEASNVNSDTDTPATSEPLVVELDPEDETQPFVAPATPESNAKAKAAALWQSRLSLLLVAALVGGVAGYFAAGSNSNGNNGTVVINSSNAQPGAAVLGNGVSIPQLVKKVEGSIVSIDVKGNGSEDEGTGMILSSNGLVVTNNHVIAAAVGDGGSITVTLTGTTKALPATLVGTNPIQDVALIRIDNASGLPTITFGDSNKLEVGDSVVAIGNALGLAAGTPTVTSGIVSALGRTVTAGDGSSSETLNNMIQTDAAINPGNSGGALIDSEGDVIGMNTAVAGTLSDGENAQNIGFAIPVATIESLLSKLKAGESVVSHGAYMGVEIESMTSELQQLYGFSVSSGAVVMSVISGTGAAAAGIEQGDVIVSIDGQSIGGAQDVQSVLSGLRPGDVAKVGIVRGTQHLTTNVTLGTVPSN